MNAPSKGCQFEVDLVKRVLKFKLWGCGKSYT
jgi:hypothetical protein